MQQDFIKRVTEFNADHCTAVPSMVATRDFTGNLIHALFPIKRNLMAQEDKISLEMDRCAINLKELLYSIRKSLDTTPEVLVEEFFSRVLDVFDQLVEDANAITRFDPAASSVAEIVLSYPGFFCISVYRMAHILYDLKVPVLPRVMTEYAHEKTGIDIHPGAEIDSPFFIDHGTGVVIGETAQIGKEVKIYQGVTL
jgi:serine O-acetyltransferase